MQDPIVTTVLGMVAATAAELTGTGDGKLFAFTSGNPSNLIQYDKTDASVIESIPLNLPNNGAFAFAHWNGDFYFFTSAGGNSTVTKYDYTGNQMLSMVGNAPLVVVGAGVSTCAPLPQ
jgi:hypothetical protein